MRTLSSAGIRVVARIEPYMVFLNDDPTAVAQYVDDVWKAGVRHMTFDTYSYSANNPGIRRNFQLSGYDYDRAFLLTTDSQPLGSFLLTEFMNIFRAKGFSCSTFDLGNVPTNDDMVCCEVSNYFAAGTGFNYGSAVAAIRFIKNSQGQSVSWADYAKWVNRHGGFLSDELERSVKALWSLIGSGAFFVTWAQGIEPAGADVDGARWQFKKQTDFRKQIFENFI
jgi:hypothetical protein